MAAHAVSPLTGGLLRRGVSVHHRRRLLAVAATASEAPSPTPAPSHPPPSSASPRKGYFPKRGETIELTCEALAYKGKGVCKVEGSTFVLLCDGALPGERLLARVRRLRRGAFAEAAKLRTLEPHHDAVDAPCPLAADCGGCKSQSLAYGAQIRHKHLQVRDLLANFGKFDPKHLESAEPDAILKPIVPCDEIFRYRNKVRFGCRV
jgi:tRNA/tmRNA/rRNA uracil-C5-methylase (TrmA/RlmC/RlmD family)